MNIPLIVLFLWTVAAALLISLLGSDVTAISNVAKRALYYLVTFPYKWLHWLQAFFADHLPAGFLRGVAGWFKR